MGHPPPPSDHELVTPEEVTIAALRGDDGLTYYRVVLRDDQLDLIAQRVVDRLLRVAAEARSGLTLATDAEIAPGYGCLTCEHPKASHQGRTVIPEPGGACRMAGCLCTGWSG